MCTTVVVGRNRSATGSVLLAHSEELGRNSAHRVEVCPRRAPSAGEPFPLFSGGSLAQPEVLARYVATKIFDKRHYPGEHTGGINEHGVAVANNMALMRGVPEARAYDVVPGGIIWTELLQLALERARTAREGAALVGELAGAHGLSCDSGTMVAVADPQDAWWVELARDGQWAAQRVGPDEVAMRANCYRIRGIDFADRDRFLCSPSLGDYARGRGWYEDGPFDFAAVYGDPGNQEDAYNLDRHRAFESGCLNLETVDVPDLMRFLREVYEGTPLYRTRPDGSPFRTGVRTIARMNTEASCVLEPRPRLAASRRTPDVVQPVDLADGGLPALPPGDRVRRAPLRHRHPRLRSPARPTGCSRSWPSSPTTATRVASTASPPPGAASSSTRSPPCRPWRPGRPLSRKRRRARFSPSSTAAGPKPPSRPSSGCCPR